MSKDVNIDSLVELVSSKMEASGVTISKAVLELAIKSYNEVKVDQLLTGNSVVEEGIGKISPSWRRVSTQFAIVPYTSKLAISVDSGLKKKMNNLIETSSQYRAAIGAQEL